MEVFRRVEGYGHEQVVFCRNDEAGLRAIIAIHSTALGPALGGCRMWPYKTEEEALEDVLRLSRGMTYKNAAMGLNFGGGKAVIIGDPRKDKSELLFRAFGRFVQSLGGRYYTAEDVGLGPEDLEFVAQETDYVLGLSETSGDPSPVTAWGVFHGIQASLEEVFGDPSPKGRHVVIQGAGHVGYHLAKYLKEAGARVSIADIFPDKAEKAQKDLGVEVLPPEDIHRVPCDVFAPCALGGVLNEKTIPELNCKIVAGSANNQLGKTGDGELLRQRGILYAPDFVINGGGVINVAEEMHPEGYSRERALKKVATIADKLREIYRIAKEQGISTEKAADVMAETRLEKVTRLQRMYLPEE
ncbi:MAG: leucine dehydrogenase [Clostridiales bacterium]|nr:leucine dehydrogenase [Clostridiales bacterium]